MAQSQDPEEQLAGFMAKYTPEIAALAEAVRNEMRRLYPTALELVYDNYNALAIGYSSTERASDAVFSIALFPRWISLFFLQAKGLPDPDELLQGSGTVARHVVLSSPAVLHEPALRELMAEAEARAKTAFDPNGTHRLVIRSVSANQRPRRPAEANQTFIGRAPRKSSLKTTKQPVRAAKARGAKA